MKLGNVKRSTEQMINKAVEMQRRWMEKMRARGKQLFKYLSKHTVKTVQTVVAVTPLVNKLQDNEVSKQSYWAKWKYLFSVAFVVAIIILCVWFLTSVGCERKDKTESANTHEIVLVQEDAQAGDTDKPAEVAKDSNPTVEPAQPAATKDKAVSGATKSNPVISGGEYVVQKGDCLWNIAVKYTGNGFDYKTLAEQNNISNPDLILPGQVIKLAK